MLVAESLLDGNGQLARHVIHSAAADAPDVVMARVVGVKPPLPAAQVQLPDDSAPREQFEVAVNGSQTDPRQATFDKLIQFVSRRMRLSPPQLIQQHHPLSGFPQRTSL